MNRREAESDTTENISLISRYEMLLMLENWLEWQQVCGTDYGKINDVSLLKMKLPKMDLVMQHFCTVYQIVNLKGEIWVG